MLERDLVNKTHLTLLPCWTIPVSLLESTQFADARRASLSKLHQCLTSAGSCEWSNSCILCSCKGSVQTTPCPWKSTWPSWTLAATTLLPFSQGKPLHLHFETLL